MLLAGKPVTRLTYKISNTDLLEMQAPSKELIEKECNVLILSRII
jgi:hypothetical protein